MGRYRYTAYDKDTRPRYVVVWDLHWSVVESQFIEAGSDLSAAMGAAIERLKGGGWQPEGTPEFGFVFIRNGDERRLLMLTARDPYSCELQSFSPYRSL